MNPSRTKTRPLDRTLVMEWSTTIAELHQRKSGPRGSIAAKVSRDSTFVTGDANLDPVRPMTIEDIKSAVMIHSYRPFKIALTVSGVTLPYTVNSGLFVHFGQMERIDLLSIDEPERIVYIRS